jgi:phospholipase/carboxylesterase
LSSWGLEVSRASGLAVVLLTSVACGPSLEVLTSGGSGPPTLVLLHGFGSSAEEWLPFTQTIEWPAPGRFVFPQAPGRTERPGGRAWWPLELEPFSPTARDATELSRTRPPGLEPAAAAVTGLLRRLAWSPGGDIVLGGFSQGAMVASDVAFRSTARIAALVLLSGAPVDEASWHRGYPARRDLPVFIAHGRSDAVLPFTGSERMQRDLAAAGLRVAWVPFDGGHEIPAEVVVSLNAFLRAVREGESPTF